MFNTYTAIKNIGGLENEDDYPYEGESEQCHFNKSEVQVTVAGGVNITSNETQMAQWLVKNGPHLHRHQRQCNAGFEGTSLVMIACVCSQFYFGGVSHPWSFLCDPESLDHGVLIVGYGVHTYPMFHKTLPFWVIKNSWGPSWGEQGYYRVYRGDGTC
ncbi:unnamed protein product, partial [Timema podura]|nr:unnamed protein product [Timema podura]